MALPKDLRQEVLRSAPLETTYKPGAAMKDIPWMLGKLDVTATVCALIKDSLMRLTFFPHPDTDMMVVAKLTRAGKGKLGGRDTAGKDENDA
jgi:hypothetical protein